jgi:hypothetical protein
MVPDNYSQYSNYCFFHYYTEANGSRECSDIVTDKTIQITLNKKHVNSLLECPDMALK